MLKVYWGKKSCERNKKMEFKNLEFRGWQHWNLPWMLLYPDNKDHFQKSVITKQAKLNLKIQCGVLLKLLLAHNEWAFKLLKQLLFDLGEFGWIERTKNNFDFLFLCSKNYLCSDVNGNWIVVPVTTFQGFVLEHSDPWTWILFYWFLLNVAPSPSSLLL